jgi:hypothetical protein
MGKYIGYALPMDKLCGHTTQEAYLAAKQFVKDNPGFKSRTVRFVGGSYYIVERVSLKREMRIF